MRNKLKVGLSLAILATGIVLVVVGALQGQADSVLAKAVFICMECIGLG